MRYLFLTTVLLSTFAACLAPSKAMAFETDQYTDRNIVPGNAHKILNQMMNERIREVIKQWKPKWGHNVYKFADKVYGIPFPFNVWIGLETMVEWSDQVPKRLPSRNHIYSDAGILSARGNWIEHIWPNRQGNHRVNWVVRLGSTLNIDGIMFGSDKIGHFLSEGYHTYYRAIIKKQGEAAALDWDAYTESTYEGLEVSGVYSNGDLTADYEGYLFYRSLFEDNVVPGKSAIIKWDGNKPVMQREFDWSDHVDDYWDETRNPSMLLPSLQKTVYPKLKAMCPEYKKDPFFWVPRDEDALKHRYAKLKYWPNPGNRMDYVCP